MNNNEQNEELDFLLLILSAFIINTSIVAISIFIWRIFWFQQIINPTFNQQTTQQTYFEYQCQNIYEVLRELLESMINFQHDQILECCGFDGLTLLLFQRKIFIGICIFAFEHLLLEIGSQFYFLLNEYQILFIQLNIKPNQDFIISSSFLIIIFIMLIQFRNELQNVYQTAFYFDQSQNVKLRTLYIPNIQKDDYQGVKIMFEVLKYLHENNDPGTIMAISVLPEYSTLLQFEKKRSLLRYEQMLIEINKPFFYFLTMKMEELENKIDLELCKEFKISGHAFILVDRLQTALLLSNYESIEFAPDLKDLDWCNITNESDRSRFWRIVILNLIIVTLLLFVTSPKALYQYLSQFKYFHFLSLSWTKQIPDTFGQIIQKNIPPLQLLWIFQDTYFNQLSNFVIIRYHKQILQLIILAIAEKNIRYSQYQISFFHKMFFYLMINVLVIPSFFLSSNQTLFAITYNGFNIQLQKAFEQRYLKNLGLYYFGFIMYSGSGALIVQLLRPSELWFNWLSPFLAHYFRLYENDCVLFKRTNEYCMQFGYISGQMLLIFGILLIFSVTAPIVLLSGIWYFGFRYICDSYTLIVVNKQEIESNGKYLLSLLQLCCFTVGLWLLVKIIGCWVQEDYLLGLLFSLELGGWIWVSFIFLRPLIQLGEIQNQDLRQNVNLGELIKEWKQNYNHPLYADSIVIH